MDYIHQAYDRLIDRFAQHAIQNADIQAALVVGSRARTDHPADEWSDLDLLLFVTDPESFSRQTSWYESLGEVWLSFVTRTAGGDPERRVLYAGGLDVDFALNSVDVLHYMASHELPPPAVEMLWRGTRILVDKNGLLKAVLSKPLPARPVFQPPDETTFNNLVHDFWFHTVWTAKHLRRGELWWAKMGCDIHLKNLLMEMVRWHAYAHRGAEMDIWMGGRFLEEWADPRAVEAFGQIFAHYDSKDIARALLATMHLFGWLSMETAQQWGYVCSGSGEKAASGMARQLLSQM